MDVIETDIVTDQHVHQLDELETLLENQTELIKQGDSAGKRVESICEQTNVLVSRIRQSGILKLAQFQKRREHLLKLYRNLQLSITAQKEETEQQLKRIRKGKKMIGAYRNNI